MGRARHAVKVITNPSPQKTGIIERNNRTVKTVLKRLKNASVKWDEESIALRALLLSKIFAAGRCLSSFQLARGYTPSIAGIPSTVVPPTF